MHTKEKMHLRKVVFGVIEISSEEFCQLSANSGKWQLTVYKYL